MKNVANFSRFRPTKIIDMSDLVIVSDSNGYYKLKSSSSKQTKTKKKKKIEKIRQKKRKKKKLYLINYKMLITSILLWWRRVIQLLWPLLLLIRSKYNYLEYTSVLLHFECARIRKKVQKFHEIMAVIILLVNSLFTTTTKKGIEICKKIALYFPPGITESYYIIHCLCIYY